jgi:hypothetical protein
MITVNANARIEYGGLQIKWLRNAVRRKLSCLYADTLIIQPRGTRHRHGGRHGLLRPGALLRANEPWIKSIGRAPRAMNSREKGPSHRQAYLAGCGGSALKPRPTCFTVPLRGPHSVPRMADNRKRFRLNAEVLCKSCLHVGSTPPFPLDLAGALWTSPRVLDIATLGPTCGQSKREVAFVCPAIKPRSSLPFAMRRAITRKFQRLARISYRENLVSHLTRLP